MRNMDVTPQFWYWTAFVQYQNSDKYCMMWLKGVSRWPSSPSQHITGIYHDLHLLQILYVSVYLDDIFTFRRTLKAICHEEKSCLGLGFV